MNPIIPVQLNDNKDKLLLIDQTLLPSEEVILEIFKIEEIWEAIKSLRVRGAPAIGIAAGFAMYLAARHSKAASSEELIQDFIKARDYLATSRPTAVNLFWALDRMTKRIEKETYNSISIIKQALLEESENILYEDQNMSKAIGEHALSLLKKNSTVLTHCNAGALATSGYGTALAPIYLGHDREYNFKVFADETRPLLQGSRLTAYELFKSGIDVTIICDSMASIIMKKGLIDAVLVGADRIAANGDTANKIGTSGLGILAKEYNIPMYILAPTSTIDIQTPTGTDIEIELRNGEEIINGFGKRTGPAGVKCYNPAFDVTDAKYISAIITEKGIIYPPFEEKILKLFINKEGDQNVQERK